MASMNNDVTFDASEMAKDMTINVRLTGTKRFAIRMWIVGKLFWLASKIAPMRIEAEQGGDE